MLNCTFNISSLIVGKTTDSPFNTTSIGATV